MLHMHVYVLGQGIHVFHYKLSYTHFVVSYIDKSKTMIPWQSFGK